MFIVRICQIHVKGRVYAVSVSGDIRYGECRLRSAQNPERSFIMERSVGFEDYFKGANSHSGIRRFEKPNTMIVLKSAFENGVRSNTRPEIGEMLFPDDGACNLRFTEYSVGIRNTAPLTVCIPVFLGDPRECLLSHGFIVGSPTGFKLFTITSCAGPMLTTVYGSVLSMNGILFAPIEIAKCVMINEATIADDMAPFQLPQ
jgi:hypothetical protein